MKNPNYRQVVKVGRKLTREMTQKRTQTKTFFLETTGYFTHYYKTNASHVAAT